MNLRPGTLRQRIADVFGKQYHQDLLPVEVQTAMCTIKGFVSKPEAARKKGGQDYFFVNGRFMKHPYFHKAVISAYGRLIPEGMQIPYFLYLEVEPSEIDVNIHPTKTEIKFENEQAIWQILSASVRDAIGKFCEVPTIEFDTQGRPDIPVFDPGHDQISAPRVNYNPDYNPFKNAGTSGKSNFSRSSGGSSKVDTSWESLYEGLVPQRESSEQSFFDEEQEPLQAQSSTDILSEKSPAHYQYKGRYLMTAVKSGLMIIDQHRADIRIRYERYIKELSQHTANTQKLLFPETVTFSPSDAVIVEQLMTELGDIGFDLSDLGGHTFAINGVPAGIEGLDPVQLIRQMISDAQNPIDSLNSQVALSLARSAAIPYGQILNNEEMENVINELFSCSNVNYTPDGKAILCILPQGDIEQLLG